MTRSVGRRRLLDRCSLSVPVGARLLIVSRPETSGPLLLRVLAGLARSSGRIAMAGIEDSRKAEWAGRVAHVGADPGLYPWMTPREALFLAADLAGYSGDAAHRRVIDAVGRYGLGRMIEQPMARGGPPLVQRVALAAAMLGEPEVLLLEDPLRAVEQAHRTRLLRIPGARRTVLISSRYPASEAGLVTHVALLREGRLALMAPLSELKERDLPLSMRGIETLAELETAAP